MKKERGMEKLLGKIGGMLDLSYDMIDKYPYILLGFIIIGLFVLLMSIVL